MEKVVADLQFRAKWKTFLLLVSSIAVSCCGDKEKFFSCSIYFEIFPSIHLCHKQDAIFRFKES